jgi:carbon-monoxide dehydrogenase medium subunit
MASIMDVVRPKRLDELLPIIADPALDLRLLAGGTDLLLKYQTQPDADLTLVDITSIPALSGIAEESGGVAIGAATRLAEVIGSELVADRFPVLVEGAVVVAGPQIRNLATLGGNVCNASPSADTIAPLLVLGAEARIVSAAGRRSVALDEFFVGPGQTVLRPGEMLESLWIPSSPPGTVASYTKLSPRRAMDLAVVGVAVAIWSEGGALQCRIGLGAVAPTPLRGRAAEAVINGATVISADLAAEAGRVAAAEVSPISDLRASAGYRSSMVERLVKRMVLELGNRSTNCEEGR